MALFARSSPGDHDGATRRQAAHALAPVNLLAAGIARWPVAVMAAGPPVYFGLADLFIVALAAWDLASRGRLHPTTLWGGLAIVVSQPLRLVLSGTAAWLAFAHGAVGLLG
jgi:hypothetical protein